MVKLELVKPNEKDKSTWKFKQLKKAAKEGVYMDGLLKKNLDLVYKIIRKDWDYLYVIDGKVGSGKSLFAMQLAHYVSNGDFDMEHITFGSKEFKKASLGRKKYKAIVFDEAFRGLSSSAANKELLTLMKEVRQLNLFIFIVLPSAWDLKKSILLHRCNGLFHVYTDKNKQRGYWKFYSNREDKFNTNWFHVFFSNRNNVYRYPKKAQIKGRFTKWYPVDETEYRKKKRDALDSDGGKRERVEVDKSILTKQLKLEINQKMLIHGFNQSQRANMLKINRETLRKWEKEASVGAL